MTITISSDAVWQTFWTLVGLMVFLHLWFWWDDYSADCRARRAAKQKAKLDRQAEIDRNVEI